MGGRVDEFMAVGSGRFDPFTPEANGPILTGAAPVDYEANIEPGYKPYPFGTLASVIGVPAVTGTGAVGANPWDVSLGSMGTIPNSPDVNGAQALPIGTTPETGM